MAKRIYSQSRHSAKSTPKKISALEPRPFAPPVQRDSQPQTEEEEQQQKPKQSVNLLDLPHLFDPRPPTPPVPPLQAKLTIGEPDDKYEQEADNVARQVVGEIHSPQPLQQKETPETVQREEMLEEEEEEELQMKPLVQRKAGGDASDDLERSIQQARGNGQALNNSLRPQMEQAMGADFSEVRVHTGPQSDRMNRSIQAKAFTTGQDIFFKQGEYNPGTKGGQELVAHELTHVMQQNGEAVQRQGDGVIQRKPLVKGKNGYAKKQEIIDYLTSIDRPIPLATGKAESFVKDFLETAQGKYRLIDVYRAALDEQSNNSEEMSDTSSNEDKSEQNDELGLDDNNNEIGNDNEEEKVNEEVEVNDNIAPEDKDDEEKFLEPEQGSLLLEQVKNLAQKETAKWNVVGLGFNIENFLYPMCMTKQVNKKVEEQRKELETVIESQQEFFINKAQASKNGFSSICDLVAYLIMAMAVGLDEYQKMYQQVLPKLYEIGGGQSEDEKFDNGNSYVTSHGRNKGNEFLASFQKWSSHDGPGIVQYKGAFEWKGGGGGSHTWVIEKTAGNNYIVYQAYQNEYNLSQMMGLVTEHVPNAFINDNMPVPTEAVEAFGKGQEKNLNEIKEGMILKLVGSLNQIGMSEEDFKKMFGPGGHEEIVLEQITGIYFEYVLPENEVENNMNEIMDQSVQQVIKLATSVQGAFAYPKLKKGQHED